MPDLAEEEIERRLRDLRGLCGVLLGGAMTCGALVLALAGRGESGGWMEAPATTPFALALGAMLLILLSSAARKAVLRRAAESLSAESAGDQRDLHDLHELEVAADPDDADEAGDPNGSIESLPVSPGLVVQDAATWEPCRRRPLLDAYARATRVSFGLLSAAAGLGLAAALLSHSPFYGAAVCATSAVIMFAQWPRRTVLDDWLDSESVLRGEVIRK